MATRITRRTLALAAAGIAPALAQDSSLSYAGPLEGSLDKVDPASFDPVAWTKLRHDSAPLKLTFQAQNRKQAEAWQRQLRAKIIELLGGFPERGALHAKTLEIREFPAYRREKFVFESRPGVGVLGYLLTPAKASRPLPAMICVPGHGRGVDDIVGIDDQGQDRTDERRLPARFRHSGGRARNGRRGHRADGVRLPARRAHQEAKVSAIPPASPSAGAALLLGQTMIGWRVFDVMRTIDWIETRTELDASHVGCMGISGGGTCTAFSAALEPRIHAAMISGYLNTFRDSIMSLSHCIDNYVPGILNWAEMYDVAGLIAPRPLFVRIRRTDRHLSGRSQPRKFRARQESLRSPRRPRRRSTGNLLGGPRIPRSPRHPVHRRIVEIGPRMHADTRR